MHYNSQPYFQKISAETIALSLNMGKRIGNNRFKAACPSHNDRNPSLCITESVDGKVLVHCFSGCTQREVIGALRSKRLWQPESYYEAIEKPRNDEYQHYQEILDIVRGHLMTGAYSRWTEKDIEDIFNAIEKIELYHKCNKTRRFANG